MKQWLSERSKDCGYDYLLTNERGAPLKRDAFIGILKSVYVKTWQPEKNAEGLDNFSFLRLRETNINLLRRAGMKEKINMAINAVLAVASLKRFHRLFTDEEIDDFRDSVD